MFSIGTKIKGLVAASALAAGLAMASQAGAAEIYISNTAMNNPGTATISGPVAPFTDPTVNVFAFSAPVIFTANYGIGPAASPVDNINFLGFCIDIFHDMTLGGQSLQYHEESLTQGTAQAGDGTVLTSDQLKQIRYLVVFGTNLFNYSLGHGGITGTVSDKLAGVQGAIWKVENPHFTITGGNSAISDNIALFALQAGAAPETTRAIKAIYADDFRNQAFAVVVGVPEPATWGLMILGFGAIGAAMRRRRATSAFV